MMEGRIYYARDGETCLIKLVGFIRYTIGARFEAFIRQIFVENPPRTLTLDLQDTEHIDSTNLGLLARLARYLVAHSSERPVISTGREDLILLLETMGFDQVFAIRNLPSMPNECLQEIPEQDVAAGTQARTVLAAHQILMDMNDGNRARFRDAVEMMEHQMGSPRTTGQGRGKGDAKAE